MVDVYDNVGVCSPARDTDRVEEAWQLQKLGIDATNAGKPAMGARHLREGLDLLGWIEGKPFGGSHESEVVLARLLISLAYAEAELGSAKHGLDLLDLATRHVAPQHKGILWNQRGLILWRSGRIQDALMCFSDAEPLLRLHGPKWILVGVLLNRAGLLGDLGRYREARDDLQKCASLAEANGLPIQLAKALHTQGNIAQGMGDIPAALALFAKAESLYEASAPDMTHALAISSANALREAGLTHEAISRLDMAIGQLRDQGRELDLFDSEVHRARIALEIGDIEAAVKFSKRAEHRAHAQGSVALADWAERIRRESEFRSGYIGYEFPGETLALALRQRELKQNDTAELAELLAARALIRAQDFGAAEHILVRRPRTTGAQILVAKLTRNLARAELARSRGNTKLAMEHLAKGLVGLHQHRESLGSLELQTGVTSLGSDLASMGLELALNSRRPSTILTWSERSRAQAYRLPAVTPPEDPEVADLLAQVRILRDAIREAEQEGRPARDERTRCVKVERQLRERAWQTSGPGDSVPEVRPKQIHEALSTRDHAMVSFLAHDNQLHALTLVNGRTKHHPLGSMPEVDESVRLLTADLNALTGRALPKRLAATVESSIRHRTQVLDAALFGAFRKRLGDSDLVIVPTGLLNAVPWGLLPTLHGRPVTVSPSAAVWWSALNYDTRTTGRPLLASGPDLTNAEAELDTISEQYYNPILLQDTAATPTAILSALDGAPIAHLAAHGYHEPDNVLFSRMDFADGPLMAYDIARLKTPPAHVTLSACDVGQAKVAVGDETLGFTAALLYVGTRTVVSSVVKVEHEAAADIMTAYHANVVAGLAPARALAEASTRHPLSPFVCYGAS